MEAILLIGVPATGKSTFYRQRFAATHVHINLDTLKTRQREKRLLASCIANQQAFVVDNTNVTAADRALYIAPARVAGFRIIGYYFQSKAIDAIQRNRQRPAPQVVPDGAIWGKAGQLQLPRYAEGFDQLYYVQIGAPEATGAEQFTIQEWNDDL